MRAACGTHPGHAQGAFSAQPAQASRQRRPAQALPDWRLHPSRTGLEQVLKAGRHPPGKPAFASASAAKPVFFATALIAAKPLKPCDRGVFRGAEFALKKRAPCAWRGRGEAGAAVLQARPPQRCFFESRKSPKNPSDGGGFALGKRGICAAPHGWPPA